MASVNKITLIGHLGKDPEALAVKGGGLMVSRLSVATSDKYVDKTSGNKVERVDWHNVALFGKAAEFICNYGKKGDLIYIEGSVRYEKYTDKEGIERLSTKVMGKEVKILSSKHGVESNKSTDAEVSNSKPYNPVIDDNDLADDDIPF